MKSVLQNKSLTWWQIGILGLIIFSPLFGISSNSYLGPDSGGYINFGLSRPPLYPFFIWIFHIFGDQQYIIARWAQTILTFAALLYAGQWLYKNLAIPKILIFFIMLFIISLISLHSNTLTKIFSEGITFPIFIVTFLLLVESFRVLDNKKLIMILTGISLLILTRNQFYFFYPVISFVVIWHWWRKEPATKILSSLAIIILSFLVTLSLAQGYYYWINKHVHAPDTGTQWQYSGWRFLEQAMYLSDYSAAKYFQNPIEKNLFERILKQLEEAKLTRSSAAASLHINYLLTAEYHYISVLGEIQDTIRKAIDNNQPSEMTGDQINSLILHMSKTLYSHAITENLAFYVLRFTFYAGGFWICLASLIALFAMSYRIFTHRSWNPTMSQAFIMASFLVILGNAALVSLVEVQAPRYFYYSYFLYFCLFALLAKEFIHKFDESYLILSSKLNS